MVARKEPVSRYLEGDAFQNSKGKESVPLVHVSALEEFQVRKQHDHAEALGINVELAKMPPGALLTIDGMAKIFGKSPTTIMRKVKEGRLPQPFRTFSKNQWCAGGVVLFLQQRMQDAQQRHGVPSKDARPNPAPGHFKALEKGTSPIR